MVKKLLEMGMYRTWRRMPRVSIMHPQGPGVYLNSTSIRILTLFSLQSPTPLYAAKKLYKW